MSAILSIFGAQLLPPWLRKWIWIAVAVLVYTAACVLYGAHLEGKRFAAYQQKVAAAVAATQAIVADHAQKSAANLKTLETQHAQAVTAVNSAWASDYAALEHRYSVLDTAYRRAAAKPVPKIAVCSDQAGNERIHAALERARSEAAAASAKLLAGLAEYRAGAGADAKLADQQALDLEMMDQWAVGEQKINASARTR